MKNEESQKVKRSRISESTTFKLLTIGTLIVILLVPMFMVQGIIDDRERTRSYAIDEVSSKWAEKQTLIGPILTIPIVEHTHDNGELVRVTRPVQLLPKDYGVKSGLAPKMLRRGIYEVVVYDSDINCSGAFKLQDIFDPKQYLDVHWEDAYLTIGISDLRGIQNELVLNWQGEDLAVRPGSKLKNTIAKGVTVPVRLQPSDLKQNLTFSFDLVLQGSNAISVVPIGSVSDVQINSPWPDPSFAGAFLPDERDVNGEGFSAHWHVLELNRDIPNTWQGDKVMNLSAAALGVNLMLPVDDYKKSDRSAKYAILILGLTFLVFFLVEVMNRKKIHPFQYLLVGLALILFYVLLVSISEHSNFNIAYLISSASIISLISMYAIYVLGSRKLSGYLAIILMALYLFVFVTLQLADYALLLGGVGLLIILGVTMYITRKVNWYHHTDTLASSLSPS